jgi:hypothetical protein
MIKLKLETLTVALKRSTSETGSGAGVCVVHNTKAVFYGLELRRGFDTLSLYLLTSGLTYEALSHYNFCGNCESAYKPSFLSQRRYA